MAYELGGVFGDWGPELWTDPEGTTANNGPQVHANDVLTQSSVTEGADRWTGFFQNLVGDVAKYAVQRDAAKNGLVPAKSANGQPVYMADPAAVRVGSMSVGGWLVIGAAVIGGLVLVATAKKG